MAAEGPLHELGAIAIVNSDSQGMGRMMETVRRTIQLAHVMTAWRATDGRARSSRPARRAGDAFDSTPTRPALPGEGDDRAGDHPRHRRPRRVAAARAARRHRPLEAGLLRRQARARAEGRVTPAWAPLGEGNATVERAEPTRYRPDWGGIGRAAASLSADVRLRAGRGRSAPRPPARRGRRGPSWRSGARVA